MSKKVKQLYTILYMKMNILQDFDMSISIPLNSLKCQWQFSNTTPYDLLGIW